MDPTILANINRAVIFTQLQEQKFVYQEIYQMALKLFDSQKGISARILREELKIPYDLALKITEDIKIQKISAEKI